MHRKYFLIVLGLVCLCLLLMFVFFEQKPQKEEESRIPLQKEVPFSRYINGVGTVEPKSGNINIGLPFNRIVKQINVAVNDRIKKGTVLFQLENQDLKANLQVKKRELEVASAELGKLKSLPRQEDLIAAKEALKKAQADFNQSKALHDMVAALPNPRSLSKEESDKRLYQYHAAEAELRTKEAEYDKVKMGAWKPDLEIGEQRVEQAKSSLEAADAELQRTFVKAPIDGTVLQIKIHEGETPSSDLSKMMMVVGDTAGLHLRVSIDQYDVPFFQPKARAIAYRQGIHSVEYPLEFVLIEPFMVPKKYLTNAASEKVDTQILEVLYKITKNEPPLFIGEQMDVFINAENK
jgi:HlyD family secretion protein